MQTAVLSECSAFHRRTVRTVRLLAASLPQAGSVPVSRLPDRNRVVSWGRLVLLAQPLGSVPVKLHGINFICGEIHSHIDIDASAAAAAAEDDVRAAAQLCSPVVVQHELLQHGECTCGSQQ